MVKQETLRKTIVAKRFARSALPVAPRLPAADLTGLRRQVGLVEGGCLAAALLGQSGWQQGRGSAERRRADMPDRHLSPAMCHWKRSNRTFNHADLGGGDAAGRVPLFCGEWPAAAAAAAGPLNLRARGGRCTSPFTTDAWCQQSEAGHSEPRHGAPAPAHRRHLRDILASGPLCGRKWGRLSSLHTVSLQGRPLGNLKSFKV